jgi:hypothetical protein
MMRSSHLLINLVSSHWQPLIRILFTSQNPAVDANCWLHANVAGGSFALDSLLVDLSAPIKNIVAHELLLMNERLQSTGTSVLQVFPVRIQKALLLVLSQNRHQLSQRQLNAFFEFYIESEHDVATMNPPFDEKDFGGMRSLVKLLLLRSQPSDVVATVSSTSTNDKLSTKNVNQLGAVADDDDDTSKQHRRTTAIDTRLRNYLDSFEMVLQSEQHCFRMAPVFGRTIDRDVNESEKDINKHVKAAESDNARTSTERHKLEKRDASSETNSNESKRKRMKLDTKETTTTTVTQTSVPKTAVVAVDDDKRSNPSMELDRYEKQLIDQFRESIKKRLAMKKKLQTNELLSLIPTELQAYIKETEKVRSCG